MLISRSDRSSIALWWWTVDRWLLSCVVFLVVFGIFLVMASSQTIALKLDLPYNYFTIKHLIFIIISIPIIIIFSILSDRQIKALCILGLFFTICLMTLILLYGDTIKGAQRWINIIGFSFQPSELCKPFFVIVNAWLLSLWIEKKEFLGQLWSTTILGIIIILLLLQPDIGMALVILSTWGFQLFIVGIPIILITLLALALPLFILFAYYNFNHVFIRINNFLGETSYQVSKSLKSFETGGLFGKGPGEGFYKKSLPDAHSDFVFAVAAEEYGVLICCLIVLIYITIFARSFFLCLTNNNLFFMVAVSGVVFQLTVQSIIHMLSNVDLIPTKGMTLPFLSYGGSSMISTAITIGILLSLTKKNISFEPLKRKIIFK